MRAKKMSRRSFLTLSAVTTAAVAIDWRQIAAYAAKLGPKSDYPTVIIGSGLGGLCCGAYLAREGIPVTVVEQHSVPGGYATAFDRDGGRFTFEVSLHGTVIHNNETARILDELGVLENLNLVALPEVYRIKGPGLDIRVPQQDPEAYIRLLADQFPAEADGVRGFVEKLLAIDDEVDRWGRMGKLAQTLSKPIFPLRFGNMWNVRNQTLADLLDDHVKDDTVKSLLAGLWGYYGLPPSRLSAFYYAVATGDYLKNGSYYVKDRSQDLSNALAETIEDAGGRLVFDTRVEKILTADGAVRGVEAGGEEIPARAVVSNASALSTFHQMLPPDAVSPEYLDRLNSYRPSISTFIVWLGLNREIGAQVDAYSTHVMTGNEPEADYQACLDGDIENSGFSVTVYDRLFKGYSQPGASTLMLLSLSGYEPWRRFEADYRAGRKQTYQQEKDRWTDVLIRRAEKTVLPGLSSWIAVTEAATPLTNWRYTGNSRGAIYGFEQSLDNAFMKRISNRTPIKGLYLAGAWGNPGGGYAGVFMSGKKTFGMLMADWAKQS